MAQEFGRQRRRVAQFFDYLAPLELQLFLRAHVTADVRELAESAT